MGDITAVLVHWQLDVRHGRERIYRASTPRERERWHALWLLAQGWSTNNVAELLERDAHTVGAWLAIFKRDVPPHWPSRRAVVPLPLGPRPRWD
jgi:hypothetical protein